MLHFTPCSNELEKNKEVIVGMQSIAAQAVESFLVDSTTAWQPSDFLPDMQAWDLLKV